MGYRAVRRLAVAGGGAQGFHEFFRVTISDSDRCKYTCLIEAAWMLWIQAVLLQLPDIDNGMLAIGQSHESTIVTAALARQQPSPA